MTEPLSVQQMAQRLKSADNMFVKVFTLGGSRYTYGDDGDRDGGFKNLSHF